MHQRTDAHLPIPLISFIQLPKVSFIRSTTHFHFFADTSVFYCLPQCPTTIPTAAEAAEVTVTILTAVAVVKRVVTEAEEEEPTVMIPTAVAVKKVAMVAKRAVLDARREVMVAKREYMGENAAMKVVDMTVHRYVD